MKKRFAAGIAGAAIAGALVIGQVAPTAFAEDAKTQLTVSETETEAADQETEKAEETEKKSYAQLETTSTKDAAVTAIDVSGVVEAVMPSIVTVTKTGVQEVMDWFGQPQEIEMQGAASGFIIAQNDDELLIATNNHVVENSTEVTVAFSAEADDPDDLLASAKVKGTDPKTDLAVIAVSLDDIKEDVLKQLKIAVLGSSDNLKVGQTAITIGNTMGEGISVTSGIVSALNVEVVVEDGSTFTEFQTDGAANQGQSGGMIVNAKGEVIGIFNAGYLQADNMGYGIPISTAIPVLQDLINRETRDAVEAHGYMGVTVVAVSSEASNFYNIPEGAYIYEVSEGSAGEEAGLKKGDIIVGFDGITIDSKETLLRQINYYEPGETVEVKVMRQGADGYEEHSFDVTLEDGPEELKDQQTKPQGEIGQELPQMPDNPFDGFFGGEDGKY
ncbi:MAG TPA: hypothetical protein DHV42_01880 [Lachnospiraceae bacterium]|nr:hypothetical protein [Lachnospiraceae bacterium]